jgi:hypothetical protein
LESEYEDFYAKYLPTIGILRPIPKDLSDTLKHGRSLISLKFIDVHQPEYPPNQFFVKAFFDQVGWALPFFDVLVQNLIQHHIIGQAIRIFLVRAQLCRREA